MSAVPAVTMEELELERAELLPSRETLNVVSSYPSSFTHVEIGNTAQFGLINLSLLNGNSLNILNL